MAYDQVNYAPGMRIVIRDAEWVIQKVDNSSDGGHLITCEGISELVRGREGRFLTTLEDEIEILDPKNTKLVEDDSSGYNASKLYIESMLRQRVPTDEKIHLGHKAAMDPLPFQLDPIKMVLKQPRHRILIADSVGLGKTLEAGILVSELIRRGQGKRILVLAVKSMLTQFQKEFWSRFSIPLTRLDSTGIQQVRNRIPTNHNPFHYYDKAIISIDTLKQDVEYRHYLETAYWDIIVIDEAHNVAERGSHSQRSKLAKLLSRRSDTLVMLSATPHDGKAESFASLMNMLDATAIANTSEYSYDDFKDKNLVVRRFKKDVKDQMVGEFPERNIDRVYAQASLEEEEVYRRLIESSLRSLDTGKKGAKLFKVTLEKALFSSPIACLSTVENRIKKLDKKLEQTGDSDFQEDINELEHLASALRNVDKHSFSKYQQLLTTMQNDLKWKKSQSDDRLVIFTESIKTLDFLYQNLQEDFKLSNDAIAQLHGGMSDTEIMEVVENFGKESSKLRLLVCSDVASEGINLHHLSHKMIHFDVPWSLMVFQQRNGRIDRYGQKHQPEIRYLLTQSENQRIHGDTRVLEVLIDKDEQAQKNIGDSSEFTRAYSQEEEEEQVAGQMMSDEQDFDAAGFLENFYNQNSAEEEDNIFAGFSTEFSEEEDGDEVVESTSLFKDDFDYCESALKYLNQQGQKLKYEADSQNVLSLFAPKDLRQRFKFLPPEIQPKEDNKYTIRLSNKLDLINQEIIRCRSEQTAWPQIQYLWPINPVSQWLGDKMMGAFGRHQAPVLRMPQTFESYEDHFVLSGLFPNRKSHPVVNPWLVVSFDDGELVGIERFEDFIEQHPFHQQTLANKGGERNHERQEALLAKAIDSAYPEFVNQRNAKELELNQKLTEQMEKLEKLKGKQIQQLEFDFGESKQAEKIVQDKKAQRQREIEQIFDEYLRWIEETMTTESKPYIQLVAVLTGSEGL
ncbi:DEAD/DEAH box helicase [Vibrio furnissii]|uniref:DEAD/DEAH box helicase n=1 Tax=Vibrio furnissii TaxID=29494 RepID=UPI0025747755|nr:DEAD/DEAH box helicase [Vibrio furnissii]WJG26798.1 DEAD/DEAH box helicase [Vibrio furnissii]